jgi:hypothetical protein
LRAISGRDCSLGSTVFLEAQAFSPQEDPDRPAIRALVKRPHFNADGVAVRYIIVQYHPELYQFTVELRPAAGASVFEPTL